MTRNELVSIVAKHGIVGAIREGAFDDLGGATELAEEAKAAADLALSQLPTKEDTITPGTTGQYLRGDKTFQTLNKSAVGLPNVDNTADSAKPVSTPQQTALNLKTNITDLGNTTDVSKGAALVGMLGMNLSAYLKQIRIPIEAYGAVGDYDPVTLTGTDNSAAFANAIASGFKFQLKRDAKYMITTDTVIQSGMDWMGDESYSPAIYCKFPTSGRIMFRSPLTGPPVKNVTLTGFTVARIGTNAEHGLLVDNLDTFTANLRVISDGTALGGAFGVSAFYPKNRPSTNCKVKAIIDYGVNFGLQYGNVDGGTMQVEGTNSMREVIGIEPYALGRRDFVQADVTADSLTWPSHGLTTGYPLLYAPLGNTIIPALTRTDYWFAKVIDANTIKLSATKEQAIAGVTVALAAFSGTHALIKCGIGRNITVLPSTITCEDVPAGGTLTGMVDITSASGGYHEGINVGKISVIERNPTSGNYGLFIGGAHNISVANFDSTGCAQAGVLIDAATINEINDITGPIAPSPAITCRPVNVVVDNPISREFKGHGVRIKNGQALVRSPYSVSAVVGVIGLKVDANADVLGSRITGGTADCINGTGLSVPTSGNNRDVNVQVIKDRRINKIEKQSLFKTIAAAPGNVCSITNQNGTVVTYAGQIFVIARSATTDASSVASYTLSVMLAIGGGTPAVTVVSSSGLTSGASANDPSFTWSINASNQLVATPVGSTNPSKAWNFYMDAVGDISLA